MLLGRKTLYRFGLLDKTHTLKIFFGEGIRILGLLLQFAYIDGGKTQ